jgi:signal transduction histidine kinase
VFIFIVENISSRVNQASHFTAPHRAEMVSLSARLRSTTQLKGANEELKTLNESLEQRVRDRTAELRATNIDLQTEIAERTKIERVLHERNIELQNAAEAKDRFLANMSHELRTPLNGILGFAEFLVLVDGKPGKVNPKQKEYLEDILNSGKHLLQLISDVLDLAKMGAGKMELNPEKFSLGKAVEEVCAVTKPIAQKKSMRALNRYQALVWVRSLAPVALKGRRKSVQLPVRGWAFGAVFAKDSTQRNGRMICLALARF